MATTNLKAQQRRKFEGVFTTLRDELLDHLKGEKMPAEAVEWFRRVRPPISLLGSSWLTLTIGRGLVSMMSVDVDVAMWAMCRCDMGDVGDAEPRFQRPRRQTQPWPERRRFGGDFERSEVDGRRVFQGGVVGVVYRAGASFVARPGIAS